MASGDPFKFNKSQLAKLSPARRRELRELLDAASRNLEQNPLNGYVPHAKQEEFHRSPHRLRAFYGGNRSGKTTAGAAEDLIQALDPEWVPKRFHKYKRYGWDEPFRGRIITPDLAYTMEAVIDKFRELTPRPALVKGSWEGAFDKTRRILRFENGSRIDFMSFEQEPDKFGGVALHRVHYDEEPAGPNSERIRRESRARLLDYSGDEMFTMTPLMGMSWVYDKLWEKRNDPNLTVVQATMYDNPAIPVEEIEAMKGELSEQEYKIVVLGYPVHLEGKFYDEFAESVHVRKAPSKEDVKTWTTVVGIDPGSKTGLVWVGFDRDNNAFLFDELQPEGWVVPDIAREIHRRNAEWGVKPTYVIDPAARIRTGPSQEQFTTEYARHRIYCQSGQNARGPGIMEVKRRLQKGHLFISADCPGIVWEFGRYRKDPKNADDWAAIKEDDHRLDALRYAIMSRTWTLPKNPRRRDNWNMGSAPSYEPPFKGLPNTTNPPLGAMS